MSRISKAKGSDLNIAMKSSTSLLPFNVHCGCQVNKKVSLYIFFFTPVGYLSPMNPHAKTVNLLGNKELLKECEPKCVLE